MQEKTSDFQVTFDDCVYLSLGPEAKRDIYNMFDPDKHFNIHLNPPSTEWPPLVKIKQEGKASVYTTDFYFTNKLPSTITVHPPGENNNTPTADQAAAQAPVLDLTGEHIKTKEDIEAAFHALHLCPQEEEEQKSDGRKERRTSKSK